MSTTNPFQSTTFKLFSLHVISSVHRYNMSHFPSRPEHACISNTNMYLTMYMKVLPVPHYFKSTLLM